MPEKPPTFEAHQALIAQLDEERAKRQTKEREQRERKAREAREAPLRERANHLAGNITDLTQFRNERNLMLYPFCSTAKRKRLAPIKYQSASGKYWLEVTANYTYGMAKIWDFDILRFALSKAGEVARLSNYFPDFVEFSGYECLKGIGRKPGGTMYQWLKEALDRLASTTYKGNIFGEGYTTKIFTLATFAYTDDTGKMERIKVTFNEPLIQSARYNKGLLTIGQDILHEESGIRKRLLELVAVSKGKEPSWTVGLEHLQAMCVHEGRLKEFKFQLKRYALPWKVDFIKRAGQGENITFSDPDISLSKPS